MVRSRLAQHHSQLSGAKYSQEGEYYIIAKKSLYRDSLSAFSSLPKQALFVYVYFFALAFLASVVVFFRHFLLIGIFLGAMWVFWDELNHLASTDRARLKKAKNALLVEVDTSMNSDILKLLRQLEGMTEEDVIWMSEVGSEKQIEPDEILIHEKQPIGALYIVLGGRFEVSTTSSNRVSLGNLDVDKVRLSVVDSQIIGEMSFVKKQDYLPSATVKAVSKSRVWSIPKSVLTEKIKDDPNFGVRFYQVLALILVNRLHSANELSVANRSKPSNEPWTVKTTKWIFSLFFRPKQPNTSSFVDLTPGMLLVMFDQNVASVT